MNQCQQTDKEMFCAEIIKVFGCGLKGWAVRTEHPEYLTGLKREEDESTVYT